MAINSQQKYIVCTQIIIKRYSPGFFIMDQKRCSGEVAAGQWSNEGQIILEIGLFPAAGLATTHSTRGATDRVCPFVLHRAIIR